MSSSHGLSHCSAVMASRLQTDRKPRLLQVPPPEEVHFEEPPLSIWQKALPLALIFFCASFNLTILQVKLCLSQRYRSAPCQALLREAATPANTWRLHRANRS